MADTAPLEVDVATRGRILERAAARRESPDQVVRAALAALERDERRLAASAVPPAAKGDPVDLDEIRAMQQDLAALHDE